MQSSVFKALGLAVLLTACGPKSGTNETAAANSTAPAAAEVNEMSNMTMAPGDEMAKGTGKVAAIDKSAGTITLDHGPIAEAGWPAMTMAFKASPELIDSVKAGDAVDFDLKLEGGAGEITAISKK